MIQKCDYKDCEKAGICRCPKTRELRDYWHFCPKHAAEYNQNWNYYRNMTEKEIEEDWEESVFGPKPKTNSAEYVRFLNDFFAGRADFDKIPPKKAAMPSNVLRALKTLELPPTAGLNDAQKQYRRLAKLYHPDTTKHADKQTAARAFAAISGAFSALEKYFQKN